MTTPLPPGTRVRRLSSPETPGVVIRSDDRHATVFWASGQEDTVPLSSLLADTPTVSFVAPEELSLDLVHRRLEHPLTDQLLSYRASRTTLLPHQFLPVRKLVANPSRRLLIADEVGTGKTIEAGLIWAELEARSEHGLSSMLVVCPKALVTKWQDEFLQRFDLRLEHLDSDSLRAALVTARRDGVWSPRFSHAVVGLELARREEILIALGDTDCPWDLVIVDEAHHLRNPATLSHALGRLLAERAATLLLLTATPVQTSLEDLRSLLLLLGVEVASDPGLFLTEFEKDMQLNDVARLIRATPPGWREQAITILAKLGATAPERAQSLAPLTHALPDQAAPLSVRLAFLDRITDAQATSPYITRTMRIDVDAHRPLREAVVHRPPFTAAQQEFYDTVYDLCLARARALGAPPGFVTQMPERRTASCPPAVAEEILDLQMERENDPELSASFTSDEVAVLAPLARQVLAGSDPKADILLTALGDLFAQGHTRAMVFSTFRGTLGYLERRLRSAGYRVAVIHGGVPHRDEDCGPGEISREAIAAAFRRGAYDVLLGSEVIGEGLDFEHCAAMINYDLPWNPMRVEQRIGRLDRLGQRADKVVIVNFSTTGTIEARILERLYLRLGIFERALGELEVVLGEEIEHFARDLFSQRLTPAQQELQLDRIARAIEEQRRHSERVNEEQGALLAAVHRVEVERADFRRLEHAFLAPEELRRFVVGTLRRRYPPDTVREGPDGTIEVMLPAVEADLAQLSRATPPSSSARDRLRRLAARARRSGERLLGRFDEAEHRDGVDFVHVRHPIVLLCRHVQRSRTGPSRVANGRLAARPGLAPGVYVFAWAIGSYIGLVSRVELLAAATDVHGQAISLPEAEKTLRWLEEASPTSEPAPIADLPATLDSLERRLAELAALGRDRLSERNALAASRARSALRFSVEGRQRWLRERLTLLDIDERLRRMYQGWEARLEGELRSRVDDLDRRSVLEYSCQFLGAAVLHVG